MKATPSQNTYFHNKLPIDSDEIIIAVYRHHPIAYIIPLLLAALMIIVIIGLAFALTTISVTGSTIIDPAFQSNIFIGVGIFSLLILIFSYIPIWTKMQDQIVLTNESVIQILQTSLFSDRISQLSLQHVADVTVNAGFWGNMFGYGHITIETPGEQDNFEYGMLPDANVAAREISEAHENFIALLESGQMHPDAPNPNETPGMAWPQTPAAPIITVDPAEYQKFLEYQKQQNVNTPPTYPPAPPQQ